MIGNVLSKLIVQWINITSSGTPTIQTPTSFSNASYAYSVAYGDIYATVGVEIRGASIGNRTLNSFQSAFGGSWIKQFILIGT